MLFCDFGTDTTGGVTRRVYPATLDDLHDIANALTMRGFVFVKTGANEPSMWETTEQGFVIHGYTDGGWRMICLAPTEGLAVIVIEALDTMRPGLKVDYKILDRPA